MIKLAIDAMGGDFAPEITINGAMRAIKEFPDLELLVYGDELLIKKYLTNNERIKIIPAARVIEMGEKDPIREVRENRDSSLVMAFDAVKSHEAEGVVSAGPTQAIIAAAHVVIKRIKGMKRLALAPNLPSQKETGLILLDSGANTIIEPEHMVQHAIFASIYAREVKNIKDPKVYLLNIGAEAGKGRELEKAAYNLLQAAPINFCGNIEPKEMLTSDADVIVTDGFTGNIALKTFEGAAKSFGQVLKSELFSSFNGKLGSLLAKKNLKKFKNHFDAEEIGGAILLGADGVVIKAHGSSSDKAFYNAIKLARRVVAGKVVDEMREYIDNHPIQIKGDNNGE